MCRRYHTCVSCRIDCVGDVHRLQWCAEPSWGGNTDVLVRGIKRRRDASVWRPQSQAATARARWGSWRRDNGEPSRPCNSDAAARIRFGSTRSTYRACRVPERDRFEPGGLASEPGIAPSAGSSRKRLCEALAERWIGPAGVSEARVGAAHVAPALETQPGRQGPIKCRSQSWRTKVCSGQSISRWRSASSQTIFCGSTPRSRRSRDY